MWAGSGVVQRWQGERDLLLALRPRDTVVVNNLAASEVTSVRQTIEATLVKLKSMLCTIATRTVPELWAAIQDVFTCLKPSER